MSDTVYYTKEEALLAAWDAIQEEPGSRIRVLDRLSNEFGIPHEEYSEYDSTIVANRALKIKEDRLLENELKFKDIPGFGLDPTGSVSNAELIRRFDSLYELEEQQRNVERVPTESEWYLAGIAAQERIDELEPFYKKKKEEEWELLTKGNVLSIPEEMENEAMFPWLSEAVGGAITGVAGLTHELLFGWMDLMAESKDRVAHERGFATSWNPFTGFGAWDLAEMRPNPETGGWGFSENVLADEDELEHLYSIRTHYNEQMTRGGYEDKYQIDKDIRELMSTIPVGSIDPRTVGGTQ